MIEIISYKFVFIVVLAFVAGFLKTTFGIGAGVFLTPIASLVVHPKVAVGILAPLMLASDITTLRYHWKKWDSRQLFVIVPFGLIGILIGSMYLSWAPTHIAKISIGTIAIIFSFFQIYRIYFLDLKRHKPYNKGYGIVVSFIAGIASAIAHSGGIVLTFYLITLQMSKYAFISTLTGYLFFNDILKIALFYKFGILTNHLILISSCVIPALFVGSYVGNKTVSALSYSQFVVIINLLIFTSGILLIIKSIS
jgi:hypothetical protein